MNARQQRFVHEYLVDLNATQAAVRAGYSEKTATSRAHDLLKRPEIQEAIAAAQQATAERLQLTVDAVLRGLLEIAEHGESDSARVRAWELLGKHLGMFKDTVRHELPGAVKVLLAFDPSCGCIERHA